MAWRRIFVLGLAVACANPAAAFAQAWVPSQGEGSVAVLFQDLFVKDHFLARGERRDNGHITSNNLIVDVTYGLTDKIAVSLAVPFIRSQYSGIAPHPTQQDNLQPHAGFQDFRFAVRYNLRQGPLSITPFFGTKVPMHNYEYFAHAAYGPRVREFDVGAFAGRMLDPILPNAFFQARYAYTFAEKIAGVHHDRSNLDLELGYFLSRNVRVFTMANGVKTHGGLDLPPGGWRAMPASVARHHDRVGRIDLLDVGGGAQVTVTKSIDVFGSYMRSLAGRNTHALDRALTFGASWNF